MFKATIAGNVTKDFSIRTIEKKGQSKQTVTNFTVATKKRSEKDETLFVDVEVWGNYAEICANSLHKGSGVVVVGDLFVETYEVNGDQRFKLKVKNPDIAFTDKKGSESRKEPSQSESSTGEELPF